MFRLGIDVGSTTVKVVITNQENQIIFSDYERHLTNIQVCLSLLLKKALNKIGNINVNTCITGSGGLALSKTINADFIQEVIAVSTTLKKFNTLCNVAIELGGEDAKIIYFEENGIDQRMNGMCAGGTGSFIDQMASLLNTDPIGLNEYAKNYKMIYPIAARCGVFAKSDIQPLINEGATKENLSASIFQAVVNQTISGLARGKPIKGSVAFLGGPLHFLPELRNAFIRTLNLTNDKIITPENSHLYAALGCCFCDLKNARIFSLNEITTKLEKEILLNTKKNFLPPLFNNDNEYKEFKYRHSLATVGKIELKEYEGECFLGIDAGSTTTKLALITKEGELLHSFYSNNNGSSIDTAKIAIKNLKNILPKNTKICACCSTGYGELLLKNAFRLDFGEVETIAHYYGATFFNPNVDTILDIGGQDMKYIKIKNNYIDNILLNEACSSGCGSFIETFAESLNYQINDFSKEALFSKNPIDLGTRCTVFMNSNVKQAQKEGAKISDISAGLSYSIIKNALHKMIKITDKSLLGNNIVVQGGTFYNDAILRALEKIINKNVIRPDIAGIMGAFGAALIAKEKYYLALKKLGSFTTSMLSFDEIVNLKYKTTVTRCKGCTNSCILTINSFADNKNNYNRQFISGNKCEKGSSNETKSNNIPNLFKYKNERIFAYEPIPINKAKRGIVGIPRVLNMYENFPFWATFFKSLGYSVLLSPVSNRNIYEKGIESIPSESTCYPAKLVHGHIEWLIEHNAKFIFMPCIAYERIEDKFARDHYNCPIVASYSENIKNNIENIYLKQIKFFNPFFSFTNKKILFSSLRKAFTKKGSNSQIFENDFSYKELKNACDKAWDELIKTKNDIRKKGEETLKWIKENNGHGIILAGQPYHIDNEINHGIPELIQNYGFAVLTEDSVSHLSKIERPLISVDQWSYHNRLFACANFIKTNNDIDLIQLNSFGCGLDSITTDQVENILSSASKVYTCLKIDEVNNISAAKIRIRSLIHTINMRKNKTRLMLPSNYTRTIFTKEMKKTHKILIPNFSTIHFEIIEPIFTSYGYNVEVLKTKNKNIIDIGLKYVNNDACYPSIIIVGQIMDALLSGKYDLSRTAIIITQTGGGCRASNYISFIRMALMKAHMEQIPIISANVNGIEKNPGFTFSFSLVTKLLMGAILGDIFMKVVFHTRPYEKNPEETNKTYEKWKNKSIEFLSQKKIDFNTFKILCKNIITDFDNIEVLDIKKPQIAIVGEIFIKFSNFANNNLVDFLEKEGTEVIVSDFMNFFLYCFYSNNFNSKYLGFKYKTKILSNIVDWYIEFLQSGARNAFKNSKHFYEQTNIKNLANFSKKYVSIGNQYGEGWSLVGEIIELINNKITNIICCQPFACLPNHIIGYGVLKRIKKDYPNANIVTIDYDSGASEINQLNRIKLMLSNAFKNLN